MESDDDFMSVASSADDFLGTQGSDDESLGDGRHLKPILKPSSISLLTCACRSDRLW